MHSLLLIHQLMIHFVLEKFHHIQSLYSYVFIRNSVKDSYLESVGKREERILFFRKKSPMNAIAIHAEAIRNKDSWDTNQPPKKAKAAMPLAICNVSIALRIFPLRGSCVMDIL